MIKSPQSGYIALITVLIVGAASLAIGLTILLTSTDSQKAILSEQRSAQARSLAASCADEALQQMHDNTAFTGTNNVFIGGNACTYTVTNLGGSSRRIDTSSTVGNVVKKVQVHATIGASSISITSWQEVS